MAGFGVDVAGAEAQVCRERAGIDDFSRVQDAVRIERAFDCSKRLVHFGAEHLAHEWTADQPVAVLARQRASELEDEIRDVVGDPFEHLHAGFGFQIDDRAHVQAARPTRGHICQPTCRAG